MRPSHLVLASLSLAAVAGCGQAAVERGQGRTVAHVGVVFDVGGRGDHSFNDGAAAGADRAGAASGAVVTFAEGGEGNRRLEALRKMARDGSDLVVAVGFLSSHDATIAAREFPGVHFAVIDYSLPTDSLGRAMAPPPNLAGINFREEEGAYLVGAMAGLSSRSHIVGFVGGMRGALITKFEVGYAAGVRRVCPACTLLIDYAGSTPAAFRDPATGKLLAERQYARGADIIFQAAGETGAGVIDAARQGTRQVIGVDVDQAAAAPGHVLTSMIKRIDVAVADVIDRERTNSFRGGMLTYGVSESGIGYVYDEKNAPLIPAATRTRVETLRAAIASGFITPPAVR
jgi:basic membrane protein A